MEGIRKALVPFVENRMLQHLAELPDETPIRMACDVPNGYTVTITLGELRELLRVYNALRVLDGLRDV